MCPTAILVLEILARIAVMAQRRRVRVRALLERQIIYMTVNTGSRGGEGATRRNRNAKGTYSTPPVLQAKKSQERPKKPLRPKETSSSFALASNWATA